ncbi:MAG: endonuclease/exonuclease/phosphatase family protein [Deltaproteobacteria bacterium]|nr:endonuclease/exonuclease/phosphatase family protein [Nannocystaceae bacterium]
MKLVAVSYNIHKCIGGIDRRYRPERVCATIAALAPDFLLMQEVDDDALRTGFDCQVDLIGEQLGLRHRTWFPNHFLRKGGSYGNAILSRFPLLESRNIDVTIDGRKARSVLHGRFRVPVRGRLRTVHVFNLHLGLLERDRRVQLERFLAAHPFAGLHERTPVLVGGDFNDVWGTLGPELLAPAGFRAAPRRHATFPAYAPVRALDGIYVRGDLTLRELRASRTAGARAASDHLPLVAELEL